VYTRLFVYDSQGRILVSSSRDGAASVAGERIDEDTLAAVLALRSEQQYHVTPFRPDPLYDVRPTYVYHAAIRDPGTDAGGIGIVFDAEAEFSAMLQGALGGTDNVSALFIDRGGRVVASTDRTRPAGSRIELDPQLLALDNGRHASRVVEHDGQYAVMACCASSGYRDDVHALVFIACRGFESLSPRI
jgi:hypothetical protein